MKTVMINIMLIRLASALLLGLAGAAPAAAASAYYVALTGSDSNPGTLSSPFRTIQKGAEAAQAGDTVFIRAGTYRETATPPRSGVAGAPITFMPYAGEPVTVSGADVLTGWTTSSGSIYQSLGMTWNLGAGKNQLFVDGQMLMEARWPNTGMDPSNPTWINAENGGFTETIPGTIDNNYILDSKLLQPDGFWNGGIVVHTGGRGWYTFAAKVSRYVRGRIEFEPLAGWYHAPVPGTRYYILGPRGALDSAGEWAVDPSGAYLWTPQGDHPSGHLVEAKRRSFAFELSGLAYITVQGLNLFATGINTNAGSNNLVIDGIRAHYPAHFYGGADGGVGELTASPTPIIQTEPGISLAGSYNTIRNSEIAYSAGCGVSLMGHHHTVTNNLIHDVDYGGSDAAGVYLSGGRIFTVWSDPPAVNNSPDGYHQITNNTIYNTGRNGISMYHCAGNKILHNEIYNVGLQTQDNGIIYSWRTDGSGTEIAYNRLRDNKTRPIPGLGVPLGAGIYLDNWTYGYLVHHNLILNNPDPSLPYATSIFCNPPSQFHQIYNNTIWNTGTTSAAIYTNGFNHKAFNNLSNGDMFSASGGGPGGSSFGNNLKTSAPGFVDAANGNFQLTANSPAIDYGLTIAGITDSYAGGSPDAGAFEYGLPPWTAGANSARPPADLCGWWKLDESAGSTAADSSGAGNHGTVFGGAAWTSGKLGGALSLNGSSQYVATARPGPTGASAVTATAWVRTTNPAEQSILSYGTDDGLGPDYFRWLMIGASLQMKTGGGRITVASPSVNDGQWHHVAIVIPAAGRLQDTRFYLDGALLANVTEDTNPAGAYNFGSRSPVNLGRDAENDSSFFSGLLDDVRLYNRALAAADLALLALRRASREDFDGDGKSDLLLRHPSTGQVSLWMMK